MNWLYCSQAFCIQNTVTNAEKLLSSAEELSQTGECDPQELYAEAKRLEKRMQSFLKMVERRRNILDFAVTFYSHVNEVCQICLLLIVTDFC